MSYANAIIDLQVRNHKDGEDFVNSDFYDKKLRLPPPAQESKIFFDSALRQTKKVKSTNVSAELDRGSSHKEFVRLGGGKTPGGKVRPSRTFMLKPFYETFGDWHSDMAHHYPLAGWAEIAAQGLLHAGGLGHMAQRVHVHIPLEGSPILAVEIEPQHHRIGQIMALSSSDFGPKLFGVRSGNSGIVIPERLRQDAAKLGAMDFLINNQDRHGSNLLFSYDVEKDPHHGKKSIMSKLLAIDHGRSFHYAGPLRFDWERVGKRRDGLLSYLKFPGGYTQFQLTSDKHIENSVLEVARWWKRAKNPVVAEFRKHIRAIKDKNAAAHIEQEFMRRTRALDRLVSLASNRVEGFRFNKKNAHMLETLTVPVGVHTPNPKYFKNTNWDIFN